MVEMTIFQRPWSENLFIFILTPSGQLTIWRGTSQIEKHVSPIWPKLPHNIPPNPSHTNRRFRLDRTYCTGGIYPVGTQNLWAEPPGSRIILAMSRLISSPFLPDLRIQHITKIQLATASNTTPKNKNIRH